MTDPNTDAAALISQMDPVLGEGPYRFVLVTRELAPQVLGAAIGTFREAEGITAIIPSALAQELELSGLDLAQITLQVVSDLADVGLTAAVSGVLAEAAIACNVVAAFHHDHLFVPWDRKDEAIGLLKELQRSA
ncbi:MAG: ACT domain-containing protein [Erythrobacter sp.]